MIKRILSVVLAMLMLIPLVLSFTSCEKERTEEEIINDIVNSGTTALTLSIWIPTEADADSEEFIERLKAVETAINEILRDKNYSTEIELTAISNEEYETKLNAHLSEIERKVTAKNGLLPSNVSQGYVNKAVKVPYGDSYMYELSYPDVLETQIDLFLVRSYDDYKALVQAENLYALDSYLSIDGGKYADIRRMISPAVLSQYVINKSTYAIPNNHQYTNAQYQYVLIDKEAFNLVEDANIDEITSILDCESLINAIGANTESGYVPFVGGLNDAPGIMNFDESGLIGSTLENSEPNSVFDIESYTKYVELYKKLSDSSYVKESLAEGEKAAVSFFYGTNEEIKAYEENYFIIKSEKPVAYTDEMFSSMFAISKYSANYDRAMKILYLLQTNSDIITLLQYGIENVDYSIEYDDNGESYISVSENTAYNMSGLNLGNSYHTYKEDGSDLQAWEDVKESNYDLTVYPYLNFKNNFDENATDEEKAQLKALVASVNALAEEVNADINVMSYENYIAFLSAYKELATLYPEIADLEDEILALKEEMKPNKDKLAEIETEISTVKEALKPLEDKLTDLEAELDGLGDAGEAESDRLAEIENEIAYINGLLNPETNRLAELEASLADAKEAETVDEELVAKLESEIETVKNATSLKSFETELESIKETLKPKEEKLIELEEKLAPLNESKNLLESQSPSAAKLQSSEDYKTLIALYTELYNKYN